MDTFSISFYRNSYLTLISILVYSNCLLAQGNCLIYPEDSGERLACELSYRALEYKQGSKESQLLFDAAIRLGPKYAWAYYEKSVPFFKRGLYAEGVSLINKAIELEPKNYLYYRAYWFFYSRSYEYCIRDLEELYTVYQASYTTTPSGELEMRLLLAMAYAQSGEVAKGIEWILHLMDSYKDKLELKGYYDHFCLGVLYYMNNQFDLAEAQFEKQLTIDDGFADTYYYLGLTKEKVADKASATNYFQQALAKFNGKNGGYSVNFFTEFNTSREDVEKRLNG